MHDKSSTRTWKKRNVSCENRGRSEGSLRWAQQSFLQLRTCSNRSHREYFQMSHRSAVSLSKRTRSLAGCKMQNEHAICQAARGIYPRLLTLIGMNRKSWKKCCVDVVGPVTQYLHQNGYFGFTGVEILVNDEGSFVIDVNLKISSSTNLLLIAPHMAALNYPVSYVMEILSANIKHLLEAIDHLNLQGKGRAILLADGELSVEIQHKACVVVFARNCEDAFKLQRELIKAAGSEISHVTALGP